MERKQKKIIVNGGKRVQRAKRLHLFTVGRAYANASGMCGAKGG